MNWAAEHPGSFEKKTAVGSRAVTETNQRRRPTAEMFRVFGNYLRENVQYFDSVKTPQTTKTRMLFRIRAEFSIHPSLAFGA
jgi:hypothetical protein